MLSKFSPEEIDMLCVCPQKNNTQLENPTWELVVEKDAEVGQMKQI